VPALPIYADSPLATTVIDIFRLHPDCYDRETFAQLQAGSPFDFDGLRYVLDVEASKAIHAETGGERLPCACAPR
jgi:metallo-beta-lactamase family protein